MENNNQVEYANQTTSSLHRVTPLSKYLALALFIILPFLGAWIGYNFAPQKVVERTVIEEVTEEYVVPEEEPRLIDFNEETIVNDLYLFSFDKPAGWELIYETADNGWQEYKLIPNTYTGTGEEIRILIGPNYLTAGGTRPTELFSLTIPESWRQLQQLLCEPSTDELPEDFARTEAAYVELCSQNTRFVSILTDINIDENFVWRIEATYEVENDTQYSEAIRALVASFTQTNN